MTLLAEKIEAASGADRELDREIAFAINLQDEDEFGCPHGWADWYTDGSRRWGDNFAFCPLAYTASLDAAMALVPPGWRWTMDSDHSGWWAGIWRRQEWAFRHGKDRKCRTPALALCAAALRSRAASTDRTEDDDA